jgi:hypothetical protein
MKLIDVASSIKSADGARLDNISVIQIQRILNQGMRELRAAVLAAGDEVVVVPGLGRFRSRDIEVKGEGDVPTLRRVTKFIAAKDDREDTDAADTAETADTPEADQDHEPLPA